MKCTVKILLCFILTFGTSVYMSGATDYSVLETKASRFYQNKEWASSLAMYELMISQKPYVVNNYAKAIVLSGLLEKPDMQMAFLEHTQQNGLPLDAIFNLIQKDAFAIGYPNIYESFLKLVKTKQQWLARNINIQLLKYYKYRSDADNMIDICDQLLKSTPDDTGYLTDMAEAYALKGDLQESMNWYNKILAIDKNNYNSLLTLGNYYNIMLCDELKKNKISLDSLQPSVIIPLSQMTGKEKDEIKKNADLATGYLLSAYKVKPTPYVARTLDQIRALISYMQKKK